MVLTIQGSVPRKAFNASKNILAQIPKSITMGPKALFPPYFLHAWFGLLKLHSFNFTFSSWISFLLNFYIWLHAASCSKTLPFNSHTTRRHIPQKNQYSSTMLQNLNSFLLLPTLCTEKTTACSSCNTNFWDVEYAASLGILLSELWSELLQSFLWKRLPIVPTFLLIKLQISTSNTCDGCMRESYLKALHVQKEIQGLLHAVQHSKATFQKHEHILTYLLVNKNLKIDFFYDQRIYL